jgi:hypothetical protein
MSGAPEVTNTLLLWLVIATALTPVFLIVAGIAVMVYVRRTMAQVQALTARLQAEARPVVIEVHETLQHVQHIAASVRRRVDELDEGVTTLQDKTARIGEHIHQALDGTLGRVLAMLRPWASRRAS